MTIFKQYGEERSGTNYLKRLLETNFSDAIVFGSVLGWKHGLLQLTNGHGAPCATDHEDWVRQKRVNGKIYSVDKYPLEYTEEFLLSAARSLSYIVSYKPLLPWLASMKRFRFPKRDFERAAVTALFQRYIRNYQTWIALPNVFVIHHNALIRESNCRSLLEHFQLRYALLPRQSDFVVEKRIIKASTDHGFLLGDRNFESEYYTSHFYIDDLPPWVIALSREQQFSTRFIDEAAWQPCRKSPISYKKTNMIKLCTLAVGEKHETMAQQLVASLPVDIAIYDTSRISEDAIVFAPGKGFNMHCKRVPIEREFHPEGTLFMEADTTCVDKGTFLQFLGSLSQLEPGILAVHAYNAFGALAPVQQGKFVSGLSTENFRKEKLTRKVAFFSKIFRMVEDDLLQMVFPVEWFLFCKFKNEQQKDVFFNRWKLLERDLLESDMKDLREECYAIGSAAHFAKLPIERLNLKVGINHKNVRTI